MSSDKPGIGILGGTFDPIHLGHIHIASAAYDEYGLKEVWFMPAGDPYFKEEKGYTDAGIRFSMVKNCLREFGSRAFKCSDYEINDTSATYTSETLKGLTDKYPWARFYFILGYDSLKAIESWHKPEAIFKNACLLTALRDGVPYEEAESRIHSLHERFADADIRLIHTPELDISSTRIRELRSCGSDISAFVDAATAKFIDEHGLYLS